jgi:hypothetical protein
MENGNFCLFAANGNGKLVYTAVSTHTYIYLENETIYIYIFAAVFKQKMENGSPGDFTSSVYCLLIMQTEVSHLSV